MWKPVKCKEAAWRIIIIIPIITELFNQPKLIYINTKFRRINNVIMGLGTQLNDNQ